MRFFVTATAASEPKTDNAPKVALFFAAIILGMVIAQLFHFEDFVPLVEGFNLPGSIMAAHLFASCIVVLEVAALPFLLRMRLSPAMRFMSMVSGWSAVILWLLVQAYLNVQYPGADNSGLLGTVVEVSVGWWTVFLFAAFGVLSAWASWGLWPLSSQKK